MEGRAIPLRMNWGIFFRILGKDAPVVRYW